jgi:hypothetical protein
MQGTSARWAPKRNTRPVRKLGANATQGMSATQTQGPSARPQVGHPNATQVTSARWSPKRKTHPQRKRPHKGATGLKTSWRMDKKFFWLGGRVFNTASPRHVHKLVAPMHFRKANARHVRTSASLAPERNERHVHKIGAQTQRKARLQDGRPNEKLIKNENVHTREH